MIPILLNNKMRFADKIRGTTLLSTIKKYRRGLYLGCVIYLILLKTIKFSADLVLVDESEKDADIVLSVVSSLFRFLKSNKIPQEDKDNIIKDVGNLLKLYPEKEHSGHGKRLNERR